MKWAHVKAARSAALPPKSTSTVQMWKILDIHVAEVAVGKQSLQVVCLDLDVERHGCLAGFQVIEILLAVASCGVGSKLIAWEEKYAADIANGFIPVIPMQIDLDGRCRRGGTC